MTPAPTLIPPPLSVTRRIKRFAPLQLGKIFGLVYGIMGLLFCPLFLLMILWAPHGQNPQKVGVMAFGAGFALLMPILYGIMGFIGGIISAFVYNVIAKWVGGIEVEVE
jgi:hypothetical protein